MGSISPPPVIQRLDEIAELLREEVGKYHFHRMGFGDFEYNILFYRYGYGPHYAEHVIDPRDGREKLVMADPHFQHSALIYDLKNREIEWEYEVPGDVVGANPHMAHMLLEDVAEIGGEAGDIVCADRDNRWILVDRDSKEVKWSLTQDDVGWAHDILLAKGGDGFIITDYTASFCRKVKFDGSVVWSIDVGYAAKLSLVEGIAGLHSNSFGGDYLVVGNTDVGAVLEVKDSDGSIAWGARLVMGGTNCFWPFKPHSAFRLGMAEVEGNLTVIGMEAGGGIVAVDRDCRPRWGFMKPYTQLPEGIYRPTAYGLIETFHVFPTLWGTVGAVDASGKYGVRVVEITKWPRKTTLWHILAHDHDPGDGGTYYDPPLETAEWDEVYITFINVGDNPLDYTVYGSRTPWLTPGDFPSHWEVLDSGSVAGGAVANVVVDEKWADVRVFGKRATAGSGSSWKIIVTFVRR